MAVADRDPLTLTRVEALAAYGTSHAAIARLLGIDINTLRSTYPDELDNAATKANGKVAESLYRKAIGEGREGVTAAIFWLKARAGWKETHAHELSGANGGPIQTAPMFDFSMLSREDRATLRGMLSRVAEYCQAEAASPMLRRRLDVAPTPHRPSP